MKKTTTEIVQNENKRSYGIKVHTDNAFNTGFIVPVIDVRDGENERRLANAIVK